jgi:hypothetical protein
MSFYSAEELKTLGLKKYGENVNISRFSRLYNPGSMEIAALSGLIALGVAVSQLASPSGNPTNPTNKTKQEGFRSLGLGILPQNQPSSDPAIPRPSEYYTIGVQQYLTQEEAIRVRDLNNRINTLASTGAPEGIQAMKAQIQTILERGATRRAGSRGGNVARAAANTALAKFSDVEVKK